MSLIKVPNSDYWYTKFTLNGKQYKRSTNTRDKGVAGKFERDLRKEILADLAAQKNPAPAGPAPTLREYAALPDEIEKTPGGAWWTSHATNAYKDKPNTVRFFRDRIRALLLFKPLADARLNEIGKVLIQSFVNASRATVNGATINRSIAVLRIILNTALDLDVIDAVPLFRKFKQKERKVGRAISVEEEAVYMAAVGQDQRDFVLILVETAMEPTPCAGLAWADVHFDAVGKYKHGYIYDRCTKDQERERPLVMTSRLATRLKTLWLSQGRPSSGYVFPADKRHNKPTPLASFQSVHKRLWQKTATHAPIAIKRFRLYDLRHTALTRARDAGADSFDLMQMAGWTSPQMAATYIKVNDASRAKSAERTAAYMDDIRRQAGISG